MAALIAAALVPVPAACWQPSALASRSTLPIRMELRVPTEVGAADALVAQTKRSDLVGVLFFHDPDSGRQAETAYASSWTTAAGKGAKSGPQFDVVDRIAKAYNDSPKHGGRPLMIMEIGRDDPTCAQIITQRRVMRFPSLEVWSRGLKEVIDVSQLEKRLQALGVASASNPARLGRGGAAAVAPGSGPRSAVSASSSVDFFGVGGGGGTLSRDGVARAQQNEPALDQQKIRQRAAAAEEPEIDEDAPAPVGFAEADGQSSAQETALDALFAPPTFDDLDLED